MGSNKILRYWYLLIIALILCIILTIILNGFLEYTPYSILVATPIFGFVVFAGIIRFLVIWHSRNEYVYHDNNSKM